MNYLEICYFPPLTEALPLSSSGRDRNEKTIVPNAEKVHRVVVILICKLHSMNFSCSLINQQRKA